MLFSSSFPSLLGGVVAFLVLSFSLASLSVVNGETVNGVEIYDLTPQEFRDGIRSGLFDVVGDVRTQGEWCSGHVPGSTHTFAPILVDKLRGCEQCNIAIVCNSGRRAGTASKFARLFEFWLIYFWLHPFWIF